MWDLRNVDLLTVVPGDQLHAILEDGHHAKAEQVDLDKSHITDILLVPLDDIAADHAGGLDGYYRSELSLRDDHPARVLAKVTRKVKHPNRKFKIFCNPGMMKIETGILELLLHCVGRALPLPGADQLRQSFRGLDVEAERFAGLASRGLASVSDDVGAHSRAKLAIALVDVLDCPLTVVS